MEVESLLLMTGLSLWGAYNHLVRLPLRVVEMPPHGAQRSLEAAAWPWGVGMCVHSLRAGLWREGTGAKMQIQSWVLGMKWKLGAGGAVGASSQGEG